MLNAANAEGVTPLLAAAAAGSHLCLQLLLLNHSSGAAAAASYKEQRIERADGKPEGSSAAEDPWLSWQDKMGNGALHYACRSGEPLTAVQVCAWRGGVCVSGGKEVCNLAPTHSLILSTCVRLILAAGDPRGSSTTLP